MEAILDTSALSSLPIGGNANLQLVSTINSMAKCALQVIILQVTGTETCEIAWDKAGCYRIARNIGGH